jgi:hypothetical protein
MKDDQQPPPESPLPYDAWTEEAMRRVMVRALQHVAANGLPGEHHFYLSFRTDHPGVVMPPGLKAKYPQEMTIVLQHQFWNLAVDEAAGLLTVGLTFGGVPSTLHIPLAAVTGFADPHVRIGLRFRTDLPPIAKEAVADEPVVDAPAATPEPRGETPQVVSLDTFRRRTPPKQ